MTRFSILNILLALSLLIICPGMLAAQNTPEQAVEKAMSELKEAGSLGPIVEYMDWDKMFMELPIEKKKIMNVSNPAELKDFNRRVLTSPSKEIASLLSSRTEDLSNSSIDKGKLENIVNKLQQRLKEKELKIKQKITNTEFEVLDTKVNADTAEVTLSQKYNDQLKKEQVKMHKKDGKWYFSSLSDLFSKDELKGVYKD